MLKSTLGTTCAPKVPVLYTPVLFSITGRKAACLRLPSNKRKDAACSTMAFCDTLRCLLHRILLIVTDARWILNETIINFFSIFFFFSLSPFFPAVRSSRPFCRKKCAEKASSLNICVLGAPLMKARHELTLPTQGHGLLVAWRSTSRLYTHYIQPTVDTFFNKSCANFCTIANFVRPTYK